MPEAETAPAGIAASEARVEGGPTPPLQPPADLTAATATASTTTDAAASAAEPAKPLTLEERVTALEAAVHSLGSLQVTQSHDGLEAFLAWFKARL